MTTHVLQSLERKAGMENMRGRHERKAWEEDRNGRRKKNLNGRQEWKTGKRKDILKMILNTTINEEIFWICP